MEVEKQFTISRVGKDQFIRSSSGLGRILFRPELEEIVGRYGSRIKRAPGDTAVDIVPPIPKAKLKELGEALVSLAWDLDPTEPKPTYIIV